MRWAVTHLGMRRSVLFSRIAHVHRLGPDLRGFALLGRYRPLQASTSLSYDFPDSEPSQNRKSYMFTQLMN